MAQYGLKRESSVNVFAHAIPSNDDIAIQSTPDMKSCLLIPTLALAANALAVPPIADRAPDKTILLTTSSGPTADSPACLRNGYYGVYGSVNAPDHVFISSEECILGNEATLGSAFRSGSMVPLGNALRKQVLIWVGQAGVEQHMGLKTAATDSVYETILDNLERLVGQEESVLGDNEQHAFSLPRQLEQPVLYHQSQHSLILGVPESTLAVIDRVVPGHLSLVAIPSQAYPLAFGQDSYGAEVPQYLIDNLANITSTLKYSSKIDQILDALDYREIVRSVRYLTDESGSGIVSRHSFSPGSRIAAKWIKGSSPRLSTTSAHTHPFPLLLPPPEKVESTGAKCTLEPFLPGFAPNVICRYTPSSNPSNGPLTILSGHYDSRGSFGRWGAPGADDDASGSAHLLAIAHAIKEAKVVFKREVVLAFFAGEEQGLLGSAAYASELKDC